MSVAVDFGYDETTWAWQETNSPLCDYNQVLTAKEFMRKRELPFHQDKWKNWDNFLAIFHVLRSVDKRSPILDAGATRDPHSPSAFLPGLHKLGYRVLSGCNLDEDKEGTIENGVFYSRHDIQKTTYPAEFFQYIACLSVIEHGVDYKQYFKEMSRILMPGGRLFTSFDFWPEPIDTGDRVAFGAPVRIFTEEDVRGMIRCAERNGFRTVKPVSFEVEKPIVEWLGLNYTFFNLLLRKI